MQVTLRVEKCSSITLPYVSQKDGVMFFNIRIFMSCQAVLKMRGRGSLSWGELLCGWCPDLACIVERSDLPHPHCIACTIIPAGHQRRPFNNWELSLFALHWPSGGALWGTSLHHCYASPPLGSTTRGSLLLSTLCHHMFPN